MGIAAWVNRLYARLAPQGGVLDNDALEALRKRHSARCVAFKLLISANNQALELMTDMEEALQGARPFGMHYVRSQCARVLASVHRIILQIQELSGDQYTALFSRYDAIKKQIQQELTPHKREYDGPLLLQLQEAGLDRVDAVGPKVASLAEAASALGLRIPEGFVITSDAYRLFFKEADLQPFIDKRILTSEAHASDEMFTLSSSIQQAILRAPLPRPLQEALEQAASTLHEEHGDELRLAVRSSALGEDTLGTSFAGQYHSELNVEIADLADAYKEVVASKYGVTAMSYRLTRGIADDDVAMCVAFMRMINAAAGGVVYTRNPLGIRQDCLMINVVLGLPSAVVDGKGQSDLFLVQRDSLKIVRRVIAVKPRKYVCDPVQGVVAVDTSPEEAPLPALTDAELVELAKACLKLEEHYGQPQDVEFALDQQRRLYFLQCRPLQLYGEAQHEAAPESFPDAPVLLRGGATASRGAAAGEVYILRKDIDVVRCPDNAVAVTEQALPRWAPLLHRIAAIVAEQGSVAGHLANVAREFNVPALFGLPDCIRELEDKGLVTVDADTSTVYAGQVSAVLDRQTSEKQLMLGTPVHGVLERVMRHIASLHLLDSDSPEFAPDSCRTLHDITRFCHEMSVRLMFAAEADTSGLKSMSKQLYHEVPMQYWIIDLGGGTTGEDRGRFVLLEDIRSVPMLALWRGMTAVPDDAPPSMDVKGFMSVLLEATTNPELESSRESGFNMRNYFMISEEFCSLQSRFGFHFCTVEGLIGDHDAENYCSFQFKGGAADLPRRVLRAQMVGGLLEEYGFRTEVKQDALFARLEGLKRGTMEQRLMVLGYLIIHTRRLDMFMADSGVAATRKTEMLHQIRSMLMA